MRFNEWHNRFFIPNEDEFGIRVLFSRRGGSRNGNRRAKVAAHPIYRYGGFQVAD